MKKLIIALCVITILIPWPAWAGPILKPYLQPELSPQEAANSAPILSALVIYPVLFVLFGVVIKILDSIEMRDRTKHRHTNGSFVQGEAMAQKSRDTGETARQRERRRKRAQAGGDIAMALMLIEDKKKK